MKKFITVSEAMVATGLGRSTLAKAARDGLIYSTKEKGAWLLLAKDVINLNKNSRNRKSKNEVPKLTMKVKDKKEIEKIKKDYKKAEPEQLTLFANDEEIRPTPKHAKKSEASAWEDAPRFTYRDLLEQYKRGIAEGIRLATEGKTNA